MRYALVIIPEAMGDLRRLRAGERAQVSGTIERHLRHEPMKISKSRLKRLRTLASPQYRLRVGEIRVFHDVVCGDVVLLAVVPKSAAEAWLRTFGEPS